MLKAAILSNRVPRLIQCGIVGLSMALMILPPRVSAQGAKPTREQVLRHLDKMREMQPGMWNIAPSEGEYLSNLVQKLKAQRVLEIGTSNGYSAIWLALGLRETGQLITLEINRRRYSLAQNNFEATGIDGLIDSRLADALEELPKLEGPFDLVFIDANKQDYGKYLEMVLPKVSSGGVIAAHNVTDMASQLQDFLETIRTHPELRTEIVAVGPSGLSISYKKGPPTP